MTVRWERACALAELREGEPRGLRIAERFIGLYLSGGTVYAMSDICSHEFALLSGGFVEGRVVECPLHAARFEFDTGRCLGPMARDDLETYPVRVESGEVWVGL